jgi:hypothetical protein
MDVKPVRAGSSVAYACYIRSADTSGLQAIVVQPDGARALVVGKLGRRAGCGRAPVVSKLDAVPETMHGRSCGSSCVTHG